MKEIYNKKGVAINRKPIIAIDFDDTIALNSFPDFKKATLNPFSKDYIKSLKDLLDCELILWTCRTGKTLEDAFNFCEKYDIKFDYINEHSKLAIMENSKKIYYDAIIDDKNELNFDWHLAFRKCLFKVLGDRNDNLNSIELEDVLNKVYLVHRKYKTFEINFKEDFHFYKSPESFENFIKSFRY